MSVQNDGSGKRWVEVEIEVPGTPEEVWQIIATGAGMERWFMPLGTGADETEQKVGGAIYMGSGEHKQKVGEYTAWDPPRHFTAEGHSWGPDAPALAHEWTVEARDGGTCVVRVVNSYFADASDWDDQLTDLESGWPRFFRILQLYMTHFPGQECSAIHLMGPTTMPQEKVWETLTGVLGLDTPTEGASWKSTLAGATEISGTVHHIDEARSPSAVMRIDGPVPGTASPIALCVGGQTMYGVGLYFYGDGAADFVAGEQAKWQAWAQETFPMG